MELKFYGAPVSQLFDFSFERGVASSYVVVSPKDDKKVRTYQVEMIAVNSPEGIVPFTMGTENGKVAFYCNVTSLLSLDEFIKHRRLTKREFANILLGLTKIILDACKYLLSDNSFLLDKSYIFINPANLDVSVLYIPVDQDGDTNTSFRDLMVDLIVNSIDLADDAGDAFLHKILAVMRTDSFSIKAVDTRLKEMLQEMNKTNATVTKEPDIEPNNKKVSLKSPEKALFSYRIVLIVLAQLGCIATAFGGIYFLRKNGLDKKEFSWSIMLVAVAIDVLLLKALFKRDKPEKLESNKAYSVEERTSSWMANEVNAKVSVPLENTFVSNARTELLSPSKLMRAYLQRQGNGRAELVELITEDFLVGRLAEAVDYVCANSAIGKVHARISKKEDKFFVTDLNSRNGTFINDKRIDCNTEYALENKDRISFANEEYVFVEVM